MEFIKKIWSIPIFSLILHRKEENQDGGAEKFLLFIIFLVQNMIDKNKVQQCVEEWIQDKEYFLVEVSVDKNNKVIVEIDNKEGVWIDDCCDLSRFIEEHFDRDVEDFELEVGSAGIGQPFKVEQQYINCIGKNVEVLAADGKKMEGVLKSVDGRQFVVTVSEKQKVEGKKRPQLVEVEKEFSMDEVKYCKYLINFK